jgi:hypothetical protein
MVVGVDQAGQDHQVGQIDHIGARGDGQVRPDGRESAAFHQDHLIGRQRPGFRIHQATGTNRRHLCRRNLWSDDSESDEQNVGGSARSHGSDSWLERTEIADER